MIFLDLKKKKPLNHRSPALAAVQAEEGGLVRNKTMVTNKSRQEQENEKS